MGVGGQGMPKQMLPRLAILAVYGLWLGFWVVLRVLRGVGWGELQERRYGSLAGPPAPSPPTAQCRVL